MSGLSLDPYATSRVIAQSAVPFILAGGTAGASVNQFTMGNNGALSTLPTLNTTYSGGAWIYMPANGIFTGSAAGWYWFVASSATAGTVYNNTYTSGNPVAAIPATPTPFVSTGAGLVTQDTASTLAAFAMTLPGGLMGKNGALHLDANVSVAPVAANRLWSLRISATSLLSTSNFSSSTTGMRFRGSIHNRNSESLQVTSGFTGTSGVTTSGGTYYQAINTAVNQPLDITLRITDAASNFAVLESFTLTHTPSPW